MASYQAPPSLALASGFFLLLSHQGSPTVNNPHVHSGSVIYTVKEGLILPSLEGLMLKLKIQYSGYLMRRADSLDNTLMLGEIEGKRRKGRKRMRWLDGITNSVDMNLS